MPLTPFASSKLAIAYAADLLLGDPQQMPHPVRLIGKGIELGERCLMPRRHQSPTAQFAGAVLTAAMVASSWAGAHLAIKAAGRIHNRFGQAVELLLAWTALAAGSLVSEAGHVVEALRRRELPEARRRLSRIVGRDTERLDESEIARAVIETVAESLCDGVVPPLVYLAMGGVPLAYAYKAVNTLDSMIGHPEPPYTCFGRVAARLDDAANFVPARVTAILITMAAALAAENWRAAARTWLADGHKHPSPNAGQSEAAMAGVLGVRLGGENFYAGKSSCKPFLNDGGRSATSTDAGRAIRLASAVSFLGFALAFSWTIFQGER